MRSGVIPLLRPTLNKDKILSNLAEVIESKFLGQGTLVDELEKQLASYLDVEYVVTTNSATSAEHLVFDMLKRFRGLQDGDEVLCTPLTCTASNWPVILNRLNIKWVDIDSQTLNFDLQDLERKISPKTKVIYPVHWGGTPVDLDAIASIRKRTFDKFGFYPYVVEDAAHAFGAKYKGKYIGSHGNICTFSFQAIKHLVCGDGGAIVFNGSCWEDFNKKARLLRWYGIDRDDKSRQDFRCELPIKENMVGYKFHMNNIAAAIGLANMEIIDSILETHRANALFYDSELNKVPGITTLRRDEVNEPSFWIYSFLVEDRQNFRKAMLDRGIETSQVHERNDKHPCVKQFNAFLPNLDSIIGRLCHIPVGSWVTQEDLYHITSSIKKGW